MSSNNQIKKLTIMVLVVLTLMSILFIPYNNVSPDFISKLSSWSTGITGAITGFLNSNSTMIPKISPYMSGGITSVEYYKIFGVAIEYYENLNLYKNVLFIFIVIDCILCAVSLYCVYNEKPITKLLLNMYYDISLLYMLSCLIITPIFNEMIGRISTSIFSAGFSGALSIGVSGFLSFLFSLGARILWKSCKFTS